MRFLICFVLLLSTFSPRQASAEPLIGKEAENVLVSGKIVASRWHNENQNLHLTRVIYKNHYYACRSFTIELKLQIVCDKVSN